MENGAGRQADSQVGRCAISARQWELCGRYSSGPDAVCGRVPKCLAAWARTAHPHGNGRGAARGDRGIHKSPFCRPPSPDSVADCVHAGLRKISSAADRDGQGSLRRRTDGGGRRDQPIPRPRPRALAASPYLAEDAASLISAEVEELDAILDWKTARKSDILVHELAGTNFSRVDVGRGDAEAALRTAYYVRRETFNVQRHTAVPLETRGLVADWDPAQERMIVFGITKVPFFNRATLAEMLGLPESSLVMKVGDAGGGFGVRGEFYPEDFLIPCISRKLASPVKWVEDRREHFLSTNHSRQTTCDLEIACDRDGTILGIRREVTVDIGAYARGTGGTSPTRCAQFLPGPYRIPSYACRVNAHVSNKTPTGTYRGPGRVEANFFRERLIDMAAADLGLDPPTIRLPNFVAADG